MSISRTTKIFTTALFCAFLLLLFRYMSYQQADRIEENHFKLYTPVNGNSITLTLKSMNNDFYFGSTVVAMEIAGRTNSRQYKELTKKFKQVVFENDLKWRQWNDSKTNEHSLYRQEWTFETLKWLRERNISVRGHYLAWAPLDRNPYYQELKGSPEKYREKLFDHIEEKLLATKEYIFEWDAINHIVAHHADGTRLDQVFGKEIYLDILNFAHEIHPEAKLYVNEGQILSSGTKSKSLREDYFNIISYLIEHDAPLHGIGLMGHYFPETETNKSDLEMILDKFSEFGLPIKITEFDYRLGDLGENYQATELELRRQAEYTEMFLRTAGAHPAVEGILLWGFWEGRHWYPGAALYNKDWSMRPNGEVWNRFNEEYLWNYKKLKPDNIGEFEFYALPGDYLLIIDEEGQPADTLTLQLSNIENLHRLQRNGKSWVLNFN